MTVNYKFSYKVLSVLVCIALLMTYLPLLTLAAASSPLSDVNKVTDTPTVNAWQQIFTDSSTENAGGVWVDKSVFSTVDAFLNYEKGGTAEDESSNQNYYLNMNDPNNFLIALSAIASNKQVTGYSTIPTDTVFVLDMSSSMRDSDSISDLAAATNSAIKKLTSLNYNNRVAVIQYSGDGHTNVLMPLDKYTAGANGNFLEYYTQRGSGGIRTVDGVKRNGIDYSAGDIYHTGTFTQDGIYVAMKELLAADTVVRDGVQAGAERMPIMVLMTDGEPYRSTTDFTGRGNTSTDLSLANLSDQSQSTNDYVEFLTQLTAAFSKYRIEQKYTQYDLLFYTLGLGVNGSVPVLDPANWADTNNYWRGFLNGQTQSYGGRRVNPNNYTEFVNAIEADGGNRYRYYSDGYYYSEIGSLDSAFDSIVDEIILQSKYYPTFIEGSDINHSGYLSMVDTLGKYMEVKDMKHIQIGSQPFYGRNAARELSDITSLQGLNEIQTNLVEAVMVRLGVDQGTALQVILASQSHNNLYYNDTDDFNNAICWYGNYSDAVKGAEYVAVWNGNGDANVPPEANCKIQSYYFYGAGEATDGQVRVGDMRYIEVDVVTFIATGETKVRVRIPASLIPIITYEVMLNGETLESDAEKVDLIGATAPMRLIYEVGLKDTINSLNVAELAADAYNPTTDMYEFYTNKWDYAGGNINIGTTPPQEVGNSYAYFEPSAENEYLYYQNDTPVYVKDGDNYVEYIGTAHPKDASDTVFYGRRFYYTKPAGSTAKPVITYHEFDTAHLEHIVQAQGSSTSWIIPKGSHFMGNGDTISFYKDGDKPESAGGGATETYKTYSTYYVMHTYESGTSTYNMQVALGNNGKLSIDAQQGIRLQKIVPENAGLDANAEYEFTITPAIDNSTTLSGDYNLYLVEAIDNDGTGGAAANGSVTANGNSLTVTLKGNQTLYIEGLSAGKYTVTEKLGASYIVSAIGATATNSNSTTVTVENNKFSTISFTNTQRGMGNLTIAKEITHPYGTAYTVPDTLQFEMTVSLTLNGAAISGDFTAAQTKDNSVRKITADVNGEFTVNLYNEDEIEIFGLPEGTVATVTESTKSGFTPTYWENGVVNGAVDGQVTIAENHTSSVLVVNEYNPDDVDSPIITLDVNKTLTGRNWRNGDSFDFELQRWDGSKWVRIGNAKTITDSMTNKTIDFNTEIKAEKYTNIGTYYYRVVEIESANGIFGVSYDKALHGFVVEVTDATMDGALEIAAVKKATTTLDTKVTVESTTNSYNVTADFENVYNVNNTSIAIEIDKTVINNSGSHLATLEGFEFEIKEIDSQKQFIKQLPNFEKTSITGTTRATIDFTTVGTHYYAIKELGVDSNIWQYDKDTEYVTVVVEGKSDGGIDYLVATAYKGIVTDFTNLTGAATVALTFENTYAPAKASLNLNVTKTLNGRNMADNEFAFTVTPYNNDFDSNPIAISSGKINESLIAQNIAANNGEKSAVTFPTMYFDKVGTYFYNVSEAPTNKEGIKADDNTYRVVVTVTDNAGALSADYQVYNVVGTEIPFVNTYTPPNVKKAITGTKTISGRTLRNGEFTFVLTQSDAAGNPITDAKSWTAVNNIKDEYTGEFTFPEIEYNAVGTYYYSVTEQKGVDGNGVSYSSKKYVVSVEVTYSAQTGLFSATLSHTAAQIAFENTYKAAAAVIDISGNKFLNGNRALTVNDFTFELYETDSSYTIGNNPITVKNAADGSFVFKDIPLAQAKPYYFVIKENIPDNKIKGVTYDQAVYRIAVDVKDNGNGHLVYQEPTIVKVVDNDVIPALAVAFYNSYDADDAVLTISGEKELIGRTLLDDEFTFNLYQANESFVIDEEVIAKQTKNKADKTFVFEDLIFSEVGTYYFVVEEDDSNKLERVKYDDTKYYITVTVTDETDNGKLKAVSVVKTAPDATENAEKIVFTNKYIPKPTDISVDINVNKKVENKGSESITAEGFEFALLKDGDALASIVKTDKNGKAKFTLGFTEKDIGNTYNYTLTEVDDGRANVKYSTVKYNISITVSLDNNNNLVASITQNTAAVETVVAEFVNEYNYTPTPAAPPVEDVPSSPKTGDATNIHLWFALLFVSGGGLIGTSLYGRRKKEENAAE